MQSAQELDTSIYPFVLISGEQLEHNFHQITLFDQTLIEYKVLFQGGKK